MKKLKVFHGLVNYGTQAGLFAESLRKIGIEALSVAYEDRYKRLIDIEISFGNCWFEKIIKYIILYARSFYWFVHYNTFHFYYGRTLLPRQLDLPFYRIFGKKTIFHYLGKDVKLYEDSVRKYKITNMAYSSGDHKAAIGKDKKIKKRLSFETKYADLQIVCSPVYLEYVPKSILLPLAIDLKKYKFYPKKPGNVLKILHAPSSRLNKGTSFIEDAIIKLIYEGFKIDYEICENITHDKLIDKYKECDLFIDQVLGGYGTSAIEAMAIGRPTISYIRDIHFNEKTFPGGTPIIRANRDNIYKVLKVTVSHKDKLSEIGLESRKFVERHHDVNILTKKLLKYYNDLWK